MKKVDDKRLAKLSQLIWEIHVRLEELQKTVNAMQGSGQLPLLSGEAEMTTKEVLAYLKVSNTTLGRYRKGSVPRGKPPFPAPVGRGADGKRYLRRDIEHWASLAID